MSDNFMNYETAAKAQIERFLKLLQKEGLKVSHPVKADYFYESDIQKGSKRIKLKVYFGSKGVKTIVQGDKTSDLYNLASTVVFGEKLFTNEDTGAPEPDNYIGTDESGKGDYFGPLIIAGVILQKETKEKLVAAGVKDSKVLSENSISSIAFKIKEVVGDKFNVVFISPEKYNQLYEKFGNLNKLLAWGHARVIENLLDKNEIVTAVSDKFGNDKLITDSLFEKGKLIKLYQYHKAEKYTAVAAASILARYELNQWFKAQENKFGMVLPKGASGIVDKAAEEFLKKFGWDILRQTVKVHFKTTKKILD
jgi:ribonuclease HIII